MHTTASDGIHPPEKIVSYVRSRQNLAAFAITDHDTINGYLAARTMLTDSDPELISGVELSVRIGDDDMHMLAYLFDADDTDFLASLTEFQERRNERGREMINRLNALGFTISFDDVLQRAGQAVIGRPHVADVLIEAGIVRTTEEAFAKYLRIGAPAYVPKTTWSPQEAIDVVHAAGGLAVMAHPSIGEMYRHLKTVAELGLDGVEVFHYRNPADKRELLLELAREHQLLVTGGSDFHGRSPSESPIGGQNVPYACLEAMKERAERYQTRSS